MKTDSVPQIQKTDKGYQYRSGKSANPVEIRFFSGRFIRVRIGTPAESPLPLIRKNILNEAEDIREEYTDNLWSLTAESGTAVRIDAKAGELLFPQSSGGYFLKEFQADQNPVGEHVSPPTGLYAENGETVAKVNFELPYDEQFFGFGEKFTAFGKRGQCLYTQNADALGVQGEQAYKNIPFYISSRGYGLFLNTHLPARFDMGHSSGMSVNISVPGEGLEYWIIPGPEFQKILESYSMLTGTPAMPPLWSFGIWYSTGFKGTDTAQVEDIAREVRQKHIPGDVIHLDCYWLKDNSWCDLEWDEQRFPNPQKLTSHLKDQGFKTSLWINPYVSCESSEFTKLSRAGYFAKAEGGQAFLADLWHGLLPLCAVIDLTNPEAVTWFRNKITSLLETGVDVLKTDFGEDIPFDARFSNGCTGREMRNVYSLLYNKIVFETVREFSGTGLVWGRSGYAGSQRCPLGWSGDPACTFASMAAVLRAGLSLSLSGVPFWSHDIGGFDGTPSARLFVRWAQTGLFSSHSRCHGTTSRNPWDFGAEAERIFRGYARLRYRLFPYIAGSAYELSQKGLPFVAPLLLYHQDDSHTFNIDDQYYFGRDILVAPVLDETDGRSVYLPDGDWIDWHTRESLPGGRRIRVQAPLSRLPLFVRKKSIIPMLAESPGRIGDADFSRLTFLDFDSAPDAAGTLYTPKGVSSWERRGGTIASGGTDFPLVSYRDEKTAVKLMSLQEDPNDE